MYRGHQKPDLAQVMAAFRQLQHENQQLRKALSQHANATAVLPQLQRENAQLQAENKRMLVAQEQLRREWESQQQHSAALRQENHELQQQLSQQAAAQERGSAAQDRTVRLAADIANLRRRHDEEIRRARRSERAELLRAFLAPLDALEQAMDSHPDPDSPWAQGTSRVLRQMTTTLQQAGVERLGDVGDPFDPLIHEAIGTTAETLLPAEHVVQVLRSGFRFANETAADALIRPAQVIVSR